MKRKPEKRGPTILPFEKIPNKNYLRRVSVVLLSVRFWNNFEAVLTSFRFQVVLPIRNKAGDILRRPSELEAP